MHLVREKKTDGELYREFVARRFFVQPDDLEEYIRTRRSTIEAAYCDHVLQLRADRLRSLRLCGLIVQDEIIEKTISQNLDDTRPIEAVTKWNQSDKRGLILSGPAGVGKTVAACWALASVHGGSGICVQARELASRLDPWKGEDLERKIDLRWDLFVIDDLGTEANLARTAAALFELADVFSANKSRLLITTNTDPHGMSQRYGERTMDRLWSFCVLVNTGGESLRKRV